MNFSFRAATGRDDFLVTEANEDAVAWIDKWPDWPTRVLLLVGPKGCGKSHLANVWQTQSGAEALSAEDLATLDIEALSRHAGTPLVIEDVGPGIDEEALLHLYNLIQERGGSLLLTSRTPPGGWNLSLRDLQSRLGTIPVARIAEPDDALFSALVIKLFSDRQLAVTPEVIHYIVRRLERSFAEARRFVTLLDNSALAKKRKITVSLLREVFREEQE
tara:strand:+ start:13279 stop:13932 length:654 start_codon:yes stop_codon:yes gene_type:complete